MMAWSEGRDGADLGWVWLASTGILVVWVGVVGFAYPFANPATGRILLIPGVLVAAGLLAWGARRRLAALETRWEPARDEEDDGAAGETRGLPPEDVAPAPAETRVPAPPEPLDADDAEVGPADEPDEQAAVHLGPTADPAFTTWWLRWASPDGATGRVPLPLGRNVRLGRSEDSDIVVNVGVVSREHAVFIVTRDQVSILDLRSKKGTWVRSGEEAEWEHVDPRAVRVLQAWWEIRLADAVTLRLEPDTGGAR